MAYIGNTNTTQAFTPAIDYFSGNASTTAFTLSRPVASVAQVQVTIDNVAQNPSSAYTVSGSTITFTSAPLSGTNNIYVYYTSPITQVIAPGQGTVTSDSFGVITNMAIEGTTTSAALRITQLGSGNALLVEDSSNPDSTPTVITAAGDVGIGTSSPAGRMTVSEGNRVIDGIGNFNVFTINSQAANLGGQIAFGGLNGSAGAFDPWTFANIKGAKENSTSGNLAGYLALATSSSGGSVTERMRIDSSGNVGIGTTSPNKSSSSTALTVNTGTAAN